MTKETHTTHRENGRRYETTTKHYDSGASKSVTRDTTHRTPWNWDGDLTRVTTRDERGNSETKTYK
jgi:hypothetical protein